MMFEREWKGVAPSRSTAQRLGSLGVIRYLILCRRKMMKDQKEMEVPSYPPPEYPRYLLYVASDQLPPFLDLLLIG